MNAYSPTMRAAPAGDGAIAVAFAAAEAVYDTSVADLQGAAHSQTIRRGRALVTWALRASRVPMKYAMIGLFLGGRHADTIRDAHLHAIRLRLTDPEFDQACKALLTLATMEANHGNQI